MQQSDRDRSAPEGTARFVADAMLGTLARRLRLLGYDVLYDSAMDDNGLIRLSLEQHRIILTRDRALTQRPLAAHHLFVQDQDLDAQVRQVLSAFPPPPDALKLTRCSHCNVVLQPLSRKSAKDRTPDHVYETHRRFRKCDACGRIYWKGTHARRM